MSLRWLSRLLLLALPIFLLLHIFPRSIVVADEIGVPSPCTHYRYYYFTNYFKTTPPTLPFWMVIIAAAGYTT